MDHPTPTRFRAFISYSHRDSAVAHWLHKGIESYRIPRALIGRDTPLGPVPDRLFPLFRDRDELPASSDLGEVITGALAGSGHLIVICSPAAVASRWVNEEILAFKRLHGEDRIIALIVDGDPDSDDTTTACFPPALRRRLGPDGALSDTIVEPAAADLRDSGDGRANARLKVVAGLLGVGLGELTQREAQAQRRRMRLTQGLAFVFAALAIAAVWFAVQAGRERERAEANLRTGIDAAQTMIFEIAQKSSNAVGAQRYVLVGILKQAQDLLDALAQGQTLTPKGLRTSAAAQHELADALLRAGDGAGALEAADRSVRTIEALRADAPEDDGLTRDLSISFEKRGDAHAALDDTPAALADFRASLEIRKALASRPQTSKDDQLDLSIAHGKLAGLLLETEDLPGAVEHYQAKLAIAQALLAENDADNAYVRDAAIALDGLSRCRLAEGDVATALAIQGDVLDIHRRLATAAPADAQAARDLAVAHRQIGVFRMAANDAAGAVVAFDEAIALWLRLAADDPSDIERRYDLAMTRLDAGDALGADGQFGAASLRYQLALAILEEIVQTDPTTVRYSAGLATGLAWLGGIRAHERDLAQAEELLERAREIRERLSAARPANRQRRYDVAVIYFSLAALEGEKNDFAKSISWFEKAEAILAALVEEKPNKAYQGLLDMIRDQIERLREIRP